jgi:cytochrome P450
VNVDQLAGALFARQGRADPYPLYAALHQLGPAAALTPGAAGSFGVIVHGYDAVDQVLRDPAFLVTDGNNLERKGSDWRNHATLSTLMGTMMFTNAPDHGRMRRLFHQVLTVRRVTAMEPVILGIIDNLMDRMEQRAAQGEQVDFIAEFAYLLPTSVVGALLGIPDEDLDWFRPRVQQIIDYLDQSAKSLEVLLATDAATLEINAYWADLIAARRAQPRDDLVSSLVQVLDAEGNGTERHDLTEAELISNLVLMFNAGFVTTINMLGNGLPLLLDRPELVRAALADPGVLADGVEEILRYEASLQYISRWVAADAEIAGVPVPKDTAVLVMLGAANRDPKRFVDPDVFDPARPDKQSISFGSGPHYCLGAALSRVEGRLAFSRLFQRFPKLAIGEPVRNDQLLLRGFSVLPVTLG